jgi:hypothetical protein
LQTTPESRLRKANPFIVDNDSIACSLGFGFRFIIAKGLPSFVQHSSHFNGLIQDTHVGSYTQGRIAGDFLSSRNAARAERYTPKTTAAALEGS